MYSGGRSYSENLSPWPSSLKRDSIQSGTASNRTCAVTNEGIATSTEFRLRTRSFGKYLAGYTALQLQALVSKLAACAATLATLAHSVHSAFTRLRVRFNCAHRRKFGLNG